MGCSQNTDSSYGWAMELVKPWRWTENHPALPWVPHPTFVWWSLQTYPGAKRIKPFRINTNRLITVRCGATIFFVVLKISHKEMDMEINTSKTVQPRICLQRHLNKLKLRKKMQVPVVYPGSKLREVKLTTDEAWSNGNSRCLVLSFPSRPRVAQE